MVILFFIFAVMSNLKNILNPFRFFRDLKRKDHKPALGGLEIFKYIGPGLLVTVGFTDPGNWAANIATGSEYGYTLLWIVTLSTVMLILLQHNVAHLGIASGYCLAEAATVHLRPWISRSVLSFAVLASVATSLAELLGGAIALQMLFKVPVKIGALLVTIFVIIMLLTNSYRKIEKWIIGFVSIIGLSFLYEIFLVDVDWAVAGVAWVKPSIPEGSMLLLMSVLGAVVMPHNLFLHSEVIQSRQWNLENESIIKKQLKFEFADTLLSMIVGWAINSAMIILAAATFFRQGIHVNELVTGKKPSGAFARKQCSSCFCRGSSFFRGSFFNNLGNGRRINRFRNVFRTLRYQGQPFTHRSPGFPSGGPADNFLYR